MQYIVEIPEERLAHLAHAVRAINPQAPQPLPVSRSEDGLISNMEYVEDYYQDELLDELPGAPPWNQLSEQTRMDIGAVLAGYASWQFPSFGKMDACETAHDISPLLEMTK